MTVDTATWIPRVARRAGAAALLMSGVATIGFMILHVAPGSPSDLFFDEATEPSAREAVTVAYGLDRPIPVQYARWMANLARGDLGWSISYHRPVLDVIRERIPYTLQLTLLAFLLHLAAGVGAGLLAARRRGSIPDVLVSGGGVLIGSLPTFWLGSLLILLFAIRLDWLPASGAQDLVQIPLTWSEIAADRMRHLVLPVACLALGTTSFTARRARAALILALRSAYVRAARARGVTEPRVLLRHALGNAVLPLITLARISIPFLIGASILVETVFEWPGLGSLSVEAVYARDYPIVMATLMLAGGVVLAGDLAADVGRIFADPRLREGRSA